LQALGTLRLVLSGARRSDDPAVMARAVDQAVEQLEVDITSLLALVTELRPAALDQLGLEPSTARPRIPACGSSSAMIG
jgi:signal transduction histidine kinase